MSLYGELTGNFLSLKMIMDNMIKNKDIQVIDLFCGVGGASYGFQKAGFKVVAGIDKDKKALKTYDENFEGKGVEIDLAEVTPSELRERLKEREEVDLEDDFIIVGCPPCQGFSRLGGEGKDDSRNDLVKKYAEIVSNFQPEAFLFENVVAIQEHEEYLNFLKESLKKAGYELFPNEYDMRNYGVPQRRKRYLIIGFKKEYWIENFTLEKSHSNNIDGLPPWKTVRDAIEDFPDLEMGESSDIDDHEAANRTDEMMNIIRNIPKDGGSRKDLPDDLKYECHKKYSGFNDVLGRMKWDEPSPTLTTGCTNPTKGRFLHPDQDRAMTLREAAELQTFPDNFDFKGTKTQKTKHIGNALPPKFSKKMAEAIKKKLD